MKYLTTSAPTAEIWKNILSADSKRKLGLSEMAAAGILFDHLWEVHVAKKAVNRTLFCTVHALCSRGYPHSKGDVEELIGI